MTLWVAPVALAQREWRPIIHGSMEGSTLGVEVLPQAASYKLAFEITVPGIYVESFAAADGQVYQSLAVPRAGSGAKAPGLPEMPVANFFVEIPFGVDVTADVVQSASKLLIKGATIYPHQVISKENEPEPPFEKDNAAYKSDTLFPSNIVSLSEPGIIRGRRLVRVHAAPLQYNPATGEVFVFPTLRFRLHFDGLLDGAAEQRKAALATPQWDRLLQPFVVNYETVLPTSMKGMRSAGADYLVIVPDAFESAIQPLVEWKHQKGLKTHVTKLSDIGIDPDADDIWQEINRAYTTSTPAPSYLLLVGDHDDLPPHEREQNGNTYVTDHPYSLMDAGDNYYDVDLVVARISTQTPQETANVVAKILKYEKAPELTGQWYREFCTAAYFQDNDYTNTTYSIWMETVAHLDNFLTDPANGIQMMANTGWCTNTPMGPPHIYHYRPTFKYPHRPVFPDPVPYAVYSRWRTSSTDATTLDLIPAINSGLSLLAYRGHGSTTSWFSPSFSTAHIANLTNADRMPVVISLCCNTGRFNAGYDCFAEAFLKNPDDGAIGVVAASFGTSGGYNDLIFHGIMDCFWPGYDASSLHSDPNFPVSRRPAEALLFGKHYMQTYMDYDAQHNWPNNWPNCDKHWYKYHYFGDPEMSLRTDTPDTIAATWTIIPWGSYYLLSLRAFDSSTQAFAGVQVAISDPLDDKVAFVSTTSGTSGASLADIPQGNHLDLVLAETDSKPLIRVMGHCADTNEDFWQIDQNELNRVTAYFNAGNLYTNGATIDCYAAGYGSHAGYYHHSDYNPADWSVNLSEFLRLIQFYNSAGYTLAPASEDGFAPVTRGGKELDGDTSLSAAALKGALTQGVQDISCIITANGTEPVTALGLKINLPAGATYGGIINGQKPHAEKVDLVTGEVQLAWADIPDFPHAITYRLLLEPGTKSTETVENVILYRTNGEESRTQFTATSET